MDIKEAFSFKGRISRMNYFWYQLFVGIPIIFLQILYNVFLADKILLALIVLVLHTPLSIILICKSIQRLHDINISGKVILVPFVIVFLHVITPNYNFLPFLMVFQVSLLLIRGTEGSNKYGEAPLE
ncbi:Uncharacterized membrane protein YhaH, DUF805 family [Caminicella sporogenes DSM 14501]|uniref:Uncharacterized membrane protein YhaH, DUF805 family n=1 Tax=Caminicella sporogenes DSM 14501 TaxID=1121266 RepID=A0A1M6MYU9_9FIRM|nr:DUF805 domain-containing protein [Caminicella sporogenes]RKD22436.1 hypothetical protein BET04_05230 [Caminicella sporogenes]SHJ88647.1 Uncharacterized membrane protein YhaH, DUF805 family [Caminicella sporogenes DSM 14501]